MHQLHLAGEYDRLHNAFIKLLFCSFLYSMVLCITFPINQAVMDLETINFLPLRSKIDSPIAPLKATADENRAARASAPSSWSWCRNAAASM